MREIPVYIQKPLQAMSGKVDYEAMLQLSTLALKEHPEDRECLIGWHTSFLHSSKHMEECVAFVTEMAPTLEDDDCRQEIERHKARALEAMGMQEAALEQFIYLYQTYDVNSDRDSIARLYEALGDEENMLHYLVLIADDGNDDIEVFDKIAKIFEGKKDYGKACHYLELAARADPWESSYYWCEVGRIMATTDRMEEGMFYFKMVIKINPEFADAYYFLGRCYQEMDDPYRAMANYYKALEYRPDFPEASGNLGVIKYEEDSDIQSSIEFMKTALEQGPDNNLKMLLYSNLLRLYSQIGDYENKEYYSMKVLELVGFPVEFGEEDDDDEEEDDDFPD